MGAPVTPDGRYFVVRGRLWRCSDPSLAPERRESLVRELMQARSAKGRAMRAGNRAAREVARQRVDAAKHALGERGAPWWRDGAPDYNRKMAKNTPYAEWFVSVAADDAAVARGRKRTRRSAQADTPEEATPLE